MIYEILNKLSESMKYNLSVSYNNNFPYFFINLIDITDSLFFKKIKFNIIGYSNFDGIKEINEMTENITQSIEKLKNENYYYVEFDEIKFDTEKGIRKLIIKIEISKFKFEER